MCVVRNLGEARVQRERGRVGRAGDAAVRAGRGGDVLVGGGGPETGLQQRDGRARRDQPRRLAARFWVGTRPLLLFRRTLVPTVPACVHAPALPPLSLARRGITLQLSGMLNHKKGEHRFGCGLSIGGA